MMAKSIIWENLRCECDLAYESASVCIETGVHLNPPLLRTESRVLYRMPPLKWKLSYHSQSMWNNTHQECHPHVQLEGRLDITLSDKPMNQECNVLFTLAVCWAGFVGRLRELRRDQLVRMLSISL